MQAESPPVIVRGELPACLRTGNSRAFIRREEK